MCVILFILQHISITNPKLSDEVRHLFFTAAAQTEPKCQTLFDPGYNYITDNNNTEIYSMCLVTQSTLSFNSTKAWNA